MYVVPLEYFMNMRSAKSHQELLSSKILLEFTPELLGGLFKVMPHQEKRRVSVKVFDGRLFTQTVTSRLLETNQLKTCLASVS